MRAKTLAVLTAVLLAAGALRAAENKPKPDDFAAAKSLAKAGLDAEALEELKKTLKTPPQKNTPEELQYLAGSAVVRFVLRNQFSVIAWSIFVVIASVFILRRVLEPRLQINDFKDVTALTGHNSAFFLQQHLISLTRQRSASFQFVTGPITQLSVPTAVTSAIPNTFDWVKGLIAVLTMVSYRRLLVLDGVMHPATDRRGAGVTLMLARGKEVVSTTTFWEEEYSPYKPASSVSGSVASQNPTPYFYLGESAAIWLLFQLMQLKRDSSEIKELTGTSNWRSCAMNAAGVRANTAEETSRAADLFVRAIKIDPDFSAPRANLAQLLLDKGEIDRAYEQFNLARREQREDDPGFYWASYYVAVILYLRGKTAEALTELEKIVNLMQETKSSSQVRTGTDRERLSNYINFALPVIDTMRVGLAVTLKRMTIKQAYEQLLDHRFFPTADVQLNLASTYALMATASPEDAGRITYNREGINCFRLALHLEPKRYVAANGDRELQLLRAAHTKEFDAIVAKAKEIAEPAIATTTATIPVASGGSQAATSPVVEKKGVSAQA